MEAVRRFASVSIHGVGTSLGSADGIDAHTTKNLLQRALPEN